MIPAVIVTALVGALIAAFFVGRLTAPKQIEIVKYTWDTKIDQTSALDHGNEERTDKHHTNEHWDINVSKNGKHIFAITRDSERKYDRSHVAQLLDILKGKFPDSEGFRISVLCEQRYIASLPAEVQSVLNGKEE